MKKIFLSGLICIMILLIIISVIGSSTNIVITKAEHLDENKVFISDIYEETSQLDNIWSEPINDNEYVRVTFEQELSNKNDITIYPRIKSGTPKIEVYEEDGYELIAEFTSLNSDTYNKVFLTNLIGSQDTFDLKVVGGSVEFDHIIDPIYGTYTFDSQTSGDEADWLFTGPQAGSGLSAANTAGRWSWDSDETSSTGVGPWHGVDGTGDGYIYTEMTSQTSGDLWELELDKTLDASVNNINVTYYWSMRGTSAQATIQLQTNENGAGWVNRGAQTGYGDETIPLTSATEPNTPWYEKNVDLTGLVSHASTRVRFHIVATADPTANMWENDIGFDNITITETLSNEASTIPTNIQCNGADNCNISVDTSVTLNASGSTDGDADDITYFIEASLANATLIQNTTNVSKTGEKGPGPAEGISRTVWTKEASAGCDAGWTGDSGWEDSEYRFFIDDLVNTSDFDKIRFEFCAGTDEILRVVNVSLCWYDGARPASTDTACTDALTQVDGEGVANGWIYSEIAAGACEYTPWFSYTWEGSKNYFVQWGVCPGGTCSYGGNRYMSTCTDTDLSRIDGTTAAVMNPSWASDAWDGYSYDLLSIQGNTTEGGPSTTNETNTTYTIYEDVDSDFKSVNNVTVKIEVDSYEPSASVNQGTNKPDLWLEIWNSSDWIEIGNFSLPDTYTGTDLNTTNANFSLTTTNSPILTGWQTSTNQDLRIKGRYMDHNETLPDEINYTNVWVAIDGKGWAELGNHTAATNFTWNTTDIAEQTGIDLRARAIDIDGSNSYSSYFTKSSYLNISHGIEDIINPDINITFPINLTEHSNTGLDVNYTTSDDVGLDACWWSNDTYLVNHTLTDCGTNITDITWNLGNHNVTVWASDAAGNENSSRVTFNITEAADSCTCPGLNQDWEINHVDACTISEACDLGTGTLSFIGSGTTQCDAQIKTTNFGDPGSGGFLEILDDCRIYIS